MTILPAWSPQFSLFSNQDASVRDPVLHALGNGGFVALWSRDAPDGAGGTQTRLWMRVFNADGTPRSAESEITLQAGVANQNKYQPSVTLLSNGNFVVAWEDTSGLDGDTGEGIRGQIFTPDGSKVGTDFHVNSRLAGHQVEVSIAALGNGGFAVAYTDVSGDGDGSGVRTRVFDSMGQRVLRPGETAATAEDLVANAVTAGGQVNPAIIALRDGRYVVLFEDNSLSADDANLTIRGRFFKADGTPDAASDFLIPKAGSIGSKSYPAAATLADGRFVVVWNSDPTDSNYFAVKARIFNPDGTPASDELVMHQGEDVLQLYPQVVALNDGGFAVTYTSSDVTETVRIATFTGSGEFKANIAMPHPENNDLEGSPSITVLQDGRLVASWIDRNVDTDVVLTHAQIFDPRASAVMLAGTYGDDDYIGTGFNDRLGGGAGHDRLTGAGGDDVLDGGIGADRMDGGWGNDTFHVDDAGDVVTDVAGTDTVVTAINYVLAPSLENLIATGTGALRLTGNGLANAITGNAQRNTLKGESGHDTLDGGKGRDVLYGGKGRDTFVFSTSLSKKHNLDTLKDFRAKDDTIWLDNKVFKKLGKKGSADSPAKLNKKFFTIGDKAKDKNDYLIYNKKKGVLYYDQDGAGSKAAVEIAKLAKKTKISYKDFFIV